MTQSMNEDVKDQSKAGVVDQLLRVQAELGRLTRLATVESAEREELVAMIKQLQAWVKSEVRLDVESLGPPFVGDKDVYLDVECNLVIVEETDEIVKKALDVLDPALFLIVAREVTPRLLKIVSAKVSSIMEPPKPSLRVMLLAGKKGFDFRRHPPHFFIMNGGGEAREIGVSVRPRYTVGTYGRSKVYGPLRLDRNQQAELHLQKIKDADPFTSLLVEVACKAPDGRVYRGRTTLTVENHQWLEIALSTAVEVEPRNEGRKDSHAT